MKLLTNSYYWIENIFQTGKNVEEKKRFRTGLCCVNGWWVSELASLYQSGRSGLTAAVQCTLAQARTNECPEGKWAGKHREFLPFLLQSLHFEDGCIMELITFTDFVTFILITTSCPDLLSLSDKCVCRCVCAFFPPLRLGVNHLDN